MPLISSLTWLGKLPLLNQVKYNRIRSFASAANADWLARLQPQVNTWRREPENLQSGRA